MEEFEIEHEKFDWSFLDSSKLPEKNAIIFESIVVAILNKHATLKPKIVKGKDAQRFTTAIRKMCNERDSR